VSRRIQIIIDHKTGLTRLEVQGVAGEACKEFSAALEAALGHVESDTPTGEMLETDKDKDKDLDYA
jgi:hypothetical protein